MPLLETLTLGLGAALSKAIAKIWLKDLPIVQAATDGLTDVLKKHGEDFATRNATERLFRDLASEVATRLNAVIEAEFHGLAEHDRDAAVLAVAEVFDGLDLAEGLARSDLDAVRLEQGLQARAAAVFAGLGGGATQSLAQFTLRESCVYVVSLAAKLPNLQVSATRELLKRTRELLDELTGVIDAVERLRNQGESAGEAASFETRYRRALAQRLDRLQLFGVRLVGAGAREYALSIAYVTLNSKRGQKSSDVDSCLAGLKRVVVQGEAGSGKTTLLQWLAVRAASHDYVGQLTAWNGEMPFYVRLRDYAERDLPAPERLLEFATPNLLGLMPDHWVHDTLTRGALLIIDGLDELPLVRREDFLEWLGGLIRDFPACRFVLSSRPAALDAKRNDRTALQRLAELGFEAISLEPMTLADSEALVSQWHEAVGRDLPGDEDQERLERYERDLRRDLRERPAIRGLASNPLLCSMICALNWDRKQRLPDDRMKLYRLALDMLIHARDDERKIRPAGLSAFDPEAKEALLDSLAYWMMRNGQTEADRLDVQKQTDAELKRLVKVQASAGDVLQELLERSGVLRQPQHGVVDFIHRTFLEYMAARAAVRTGDLGMLAEKARDDTWRETVVFAAGHAEGAARDKLIGLLLKTPLFGIFSRSLSADVTAACCLETAGANLEPALLAKLQQRAANLFPPRDMASARVLAPAANLMPTLLSGRAALGPQVVAACIRCASIVGGPNMLAVIEQYADVPGETVWEELVSAWTSFDTDEYLDRVIKRRKSLDLAGLALDELDADTVRCLALLVIKGVHDKSPENLANAVRSFHETRALSFGEQSYGEEVSGDAPARRRTLVTEPDARRIAGLASLRKLHLGSSDPGVLGQLTGLPGLSTLGCSPRDMADLAFLPDYPALEDLQVDGLSVPFSARPGTEVDLRPLGRCSRLKRLELSHTKWMGVVRLPSPLPIEYLRLAYVPVPDCLPVAEPEALQELRLQGDVAIDMLDLKSMTALQRLDLYGFSGMRVRLPPSLTDVSFHGTGSWQVMNFDETLQLSSITLSGDMQLPDLPRLIELPALTHMSLDPKVLESLASWQRERLVARGVQIR